ncbi:hypothetical protein CDAR_538621 [Caerostris darwini]|uniref:Uncharacterized protein n=1 Tax=Caerostris darwini TaxID=1538125 RepID=A0AAV4T710_9ARAC|nr:hypothetical protein CDAR_538621 [Caerostris darwini]
MDSGESLSADGQSASSSQVDSPPPTIDRFSDVWLYPIDVALIRYRFLFLGKAVRASGARHFLPRKLEINPHIVKESKDEAIQFLEMITAS